MAETPEQPLSPNDKTNSGGNVTEHRVLPRLEHHEAVAHGKVPREGPEHREKRLARRNVHALGSIIPIEQRSCVGQSVGQPLLGQNCLAARDVIGEVVGLLVHNEAEDVVGVAKVVTPDSSRNRLSPPTLCP